jgi:hypothetical protein
MSYVAAGGEFNRDTNYISSRITADGRHGYPGGPTARSLCDVYSAWKTFCP